MRPAVSAADWVSSGQHLATPAGEVFFRVEGDGAPIVLLHGFPTWSYDWAEVAGALAETHQVIALDFPGYGFSQKSGQVDFSVGGAADAVERLIAHLGVGHASLAIHDFGGIVGQELLDRQRRRSLSFAIDGLHVLNNGIVYAAYRPARIQKLLAMPLVGRFIASRLTKAKLHRGLNSVRGSNKLDDQAFEQLWVGMSRDDGHKLAFRHIQYNRERSVHHRRWEDALFSYSGPVQLIWGLSDPISGSHVLELARPKLRDAAIVELPGVGHFPQSESPAEVAAAIRRISV